MTDENKLTIERHFAFMRERYSIMLRRQGGHPGPWTDDPILHQYRFTNIRREDDRTTRWFADNVRHLHPGNIQSTLLNTVIFRWFNRIETAQALLGAGLFHNWDASKTEDVLRGRKPIVTGAYVIKTPDGMDKLKGVLWCIENARGSLPMLADMWELPGTTLQAACEDLMELPYLGGFMAHQLVADLKYTPLLSAAPDRFTWAYPGPGTARGVSRMLYGDPKAINPGSEKGRKEILSCLRKVLLVSQRGVLWPAAWPALEMSDISNTFCEVDKYWRVKFDGQRMKQTYKPA